MKDIVPRRLCGETAEAAIPMRSDDGVRSRNEATVAVQVIWVVAGLVVVAALVLILYDPVMDAIFSTVTGSETSFRPDGHAKPPLSRRTFPPV
jgi:hypothetical protein